MEKNITIPYLPEVLEKIIIMYLDGDVRYENYFERVIRFNSLSPGAPPVNAILTALNNDNIKYRKIILEKFLCETNIENSYGIFDCHIQLIPIKCFFSLEIARHLEYRPNIERIISFNES